MKAKAANLFAEITSLKLRSRNSSTTSEDSHDETSNKVSELDSNLSDLNALITKIECRHQAVMSRNAILLQRTLTEGDRTAKDLVKKFQVISLEGENKQLKTLLGILKNKYDFNEQELADELKATEENTDFSKNISMLSGLSNGTTAYLSDGSDTVTSMTSAKTSSGSRKIISSRSDSNLRYNTPIPTRTASTRSGRTKNYSFFNEMVSESLPTTTTKYSRDLNQRSSGVSSYSSEEDDDFSPPRFPKRYNTLPSRSRRPRP